MFLVSDSYRDSDKEICFDLEKSMWRKYRSNFQDHIDYIFNDIVIPFRFGILQYV